VGKAEKSIFLCDYLLLAGDPTLGPRGAQVADGRVHRDTDCGRDLCPLLFLSSVVQPKRYSSHLFDRCHQPARLDRWRYSSRGSVNRSKFPCQAKRHVRTTFPRTHTLCGRPAALTFGRRASGAHCRRVCRFLSLREPTMGSTGRPQNFAILALWQRLTPSELTDRFNGSRHGPQQNRSERSFTSLNYSPQSWTEIPVASPRFTLSHSIS
jgi:hypothetical protein